MRNTGRHFYRLQQYRQFFSCVPSGKTCLLDRKVCGALDEQQPVLRQDLPRQAPYTSAFGKEQGQPLLKVCMED